MADVTVSPQLIKDAAAAFTAACQEEPEQCALALAALYERHGAEGLARAVLLWCDAYVEHALDGRRADGGIPTVLTFRTPNGRDLDVDETPPAAVWAGRPLAARCARDVDTFTSLMTSVPDGMDGQWVMALLDVVACSLRNLPRGFSRPSEPRREVRRE